jgi:hypothetical protein
MSHPNPLISSILIAPTATANALQVGYIINGVGIPVNSKVLSINSIGAGQWEITINKTPNSADVYTTGNHGAYSDPSGANDGTIQWTTSLIITGETLEDASTLSFKEDVKGWVSFKSFIPEDAISMANDYYTFLHGDLYKHHVETVDRNTFYEANSSIEDSFTPSMVDVVLNDNPSIIKEFNTLNYEGSQSKVNHFISETLSLYAQPTTTYNDQEYHNLSSKLGWHVESIITNEEDGRVDEFLEKEGKWFNYIKREIDRDLQTADTGDFSFQGIGFSTTYTTQSWNCFDDGSCVDPGTGLGMYLTLSECEDVCSPTPTSPSWDCALIYEGDVDVYDCIDPGTGLGQYSTYNACDEACNDGVTISCDTCQDGNPVSNVFVGSVCPRDWIPTGTGNPCNISCDTCDDGYPISQIFSGDSCPEGWVPTGTLGPCGPVYGCTDPSATNYDAGATIDDGSCINCNLLNINYTITSHPMSNFSDGIRVLLHNTGDDLPYTVACLDSQGTTIGDSSGAFGWSSGGTTGQGDIVYFGQGTPLITGTYTIIITTTHGCTSQDTIFIDNGVPPPSACPCDGAGEFYLNSSNGITLNVTLGSGTTLWKVDVVRPNGTTFTSGNGNSSYSNIFPASTVSLWGTGVCEAKFSWYCLATLTWICVQKFKININPVTPVSPIVTPNETPDY